ncbi:MarR family transcriptional regulator [Halocatena marina]|uniref:MarR family transcriptional regulator n=1 Tax=Halocatena marina TaxID=2934937 RepID=A0ABD5YTQ1_9EURY|nr:MarR family transcriptional regulator [Halocatena marina]
MPIKFDTYPAEGTNLSLRTGTNAYEILSFLAEHPDTGFTPSELHEATGVKRGSVSPTLARLEDNGLVRHKGEYWAIAPEDRLGVYAGVLHSLDAVREQFAGDYYDRNPDWADDLPDITEESGDTDE